jgi:hypothetical protein
VRIHEVIERTTGAAARCSLVGAAVVRVQEIPVWMTDTAACCWTRLAAEPTVALSALAALRILLSEAMRLAATEAPSDARIASPDSYRGDRHAAGSAPTPTATPSTRPVSAEPLSELNGAQRWWALPDQTRQTLADLFTQLLIAHASGARQELDELPEADSDER